MFFPKPPYTSFAIITPNTMPIEATHHGVSGGSERRKREHVTSTASDTFFLRFFS